MSSPATSVQNASTSRSKNGIPPTASYSVSVPRCPSVIDGRGYRPKSGENGLSGGEAVEDPHVGEVFLACHVRHVAVAEIENNRLAVCQEDHRGYDVAVDLEFDHISCPEPHRCRVHFPVLLRLPVTTTYESGRSLVRTVAHVTSAPTAFGFTRTFGSSAPERCRAARR